MFETIVGMTVAAIGLTSIKYGLRPTPTPTAVPEGGVE